MLFAGEGMQVTALDESTTALEFLTAAAKSAGHDIATAQAPSSNPPFSDASFDAVLSFDVIYYDNEATVARAIGEPRQFLRKGGIFFGTLLSKRNSD